MAVENYVVNCISNITKIFKIYVYVEHSLILHYYGQTAVMLSLHSLIVKLVDFFFFFSEQQLSKHVQGDVLQR